MYSTITSKRLNLVSHHTHTQTGAICPSLALLAHSAILPDPPHFNRTESHIHKQTGAICPLLAHSALSGDPTYVTQTESDAHRMGSSTCRSHCSLIQCTCQTLLTLVAQNLTKRQVSSAHRSHCSLIQRFWQTLLRAPPGGMVAIIYPTIHQSISQISPLTFYPP